MRWSLLVLSGGLLFPPAAASAQALATRARDRVQRAVDAVRHDSGTVLTARWRRESVSGGDVDRLARLGLATIARREYRYAEADRQYAALIPGSDATADAVTSLALLGHATSLLTRWRPAEAMTLLERARALAARTDDPLTEGEALTIMSTVASRSRGVDTARVLLRRAGELLPPRSRQNALRLCTEGGVLRAVALKAADSVVTEGLALARALGDTLTVARCLVAQGSVFEGQGRILMSGHPLDEASVLLEQAHDLEGLGSAQQWRAYTLITYAQYFGSGRRLAESAIAHGTKVGSPIITGWARLNLAQVTLRVGDAVSGLRAAREARETFRRIGDQQGELAAGFAVADAMMLSRQVQGALDEYHDQLPLLVRMGARNAMAPYFISRAAAEIELGRLDDAERSVDSAVAIATAAGNIGIPRSTQFYWRGLLALRRGEWDRSIEHFQRFKRGVGSSAAHLQLDADLRIAEAHARAGRFAAAESVFTLGSASLDEMRRETSERDDVLRLLSGRRYDSDTDLGIATIVAEFARAGRLDGAFAIAESERARWLWILRTRRGDMARVPVARAPLTDRMLGLAEVQRALDGETAVLAYVTGRGGEPTTVFAIWAGGARAFDLPPVDSLSASLARFSVLLASGAPATAQARALGMVLLDSALRAIPGTVRRLRIVPDGPLHHMPFDALVTADGRRLVERFVASNAASVRLAVAAPTAAVRGRAVAYGDAVFDPRFGLPRLPGSAAEAYAVIRAAGGRGEVRLRGDAGAAALRTDRLQGVGVLHLATHARVQDWGMLGNAIYLGAGPAEDGRIGAEDLASMSLGVGLVVLSACRTVGGLVATGEGVQGLVAPILEAGAGAVVVTQWEIRDRSLIRLMGEFYAALARGARADDALALAKRRALARGEGTATWAALSLIGDGAVRPLLRATDLAPSGPAPPSERSFRRPAVP